VGEVASDGEGVGVSDEPNLRIVGTRGPEPVPVLDVPEQGPFEEPIARIVPAPSDPMAVARMFITEHYTHADGTSLIRHHRGDPYCWSGTAWPEAEERRIRSDLYCWLESAFYDNPKSKSPVPEPFEPNRYKIANLVQALQAITHLDKDVTAPAWLEEGGARPAPGVVALANGILDLETRELVPHTPAFFTQHSLPFDYDPAAPVPPRWDRFLHELWGDDGEAIATLAEIMGYVLGGATNQQKLFMLVGPKRSGKGTIARVGTGLLGAHNVAAPTLSGLTQNFGLSPLIGKPLATISDARLGSRVDSMVAVERLLSISGEDTLTIDRKYRDPWTGQLPTRFLIMTNELPRFTDSSGALASRFVILTLSKSFYGREDPTLTDELLVGSSGIFNWCLAGLDRLVERGYFVQPASSTEALRHLEDMSSPVSAFLRDECEVGPTHEASKDALFDAWKAWCETEGRASAGTKAVFFRDLRAAVPGIKEKRAREGEERWHVMQGIGLSGTNK
jgi:putative DNA primase/helicase